MHDFLNGMKFNDASFPYISTFRVGFFFMTEEGERFLRACRGSNSSQHEHSSQDGEDPIPLYCRVPAIEFTDESIAIRDGREEEKKKGTSATPAVLVESSDSEHEEERKKRQRHPKASTAESPKLAAFEKEMKEVKDRLAVCEAMLMGSGSVATNRGPMDCEILFGQIVTQLKPIMAGAGGCLIRHGYLL